MIKLINNIYTTLGKFVDIPVLFLRIALAKIFWDSAQTKLPNWDNTVFLFAEEYKVPLISPEIAAYMATGVELVAPVLLVLGLFTRFGAAMLLVLTAVIEFTYTHSDEHYMWAAVSLLLITYGAGKISLDNLLKRKFG